MGRVGKSEVKRNHSEKEEKIQPTHSPIRQMMYLFICIIYIIVLIYSNKRRICVIKYVIK